MTLLVFAARTTGEFHPSLQLAYESSVSGRREIGLLDSSSGRTYLISRPPLDEYEPHWSADGTRLLYRTFVDYGRGDLTEFNLNSLERFQMATHAATGTARAVLPASGGIPRAFTLGYGQMWLSGVGSGSQALGYGFNPQLSPDGEWVLYYADTPDDLNAEVYAYHLITHQRLNLTQHAGHDWSPAWSPDGKQIAFVSTRDGNAEIYSVEMACGAQHTCAFDARRLTFTPHGETGPSWSPDGASLIYARGVRGYSQLFLYDLESGDERQLTAGLMDYRAPVIRP